MKYIIKNCPAHFNNVQMLEFSEGDCNSDKVRGAYCKDNSFCPLKQIVEKCKSDIGSKNNMFLVSRYDLAGKILELLEIEECENECIQN